MIVEHCGKVHVTTRHHQCMSIYRDFAEISWCPDYVNLQRFCRDFKVRAPTMSVYRDFMVPRLCQFTEILQRFHGAPTMSIYRDFLVPRLSQVTDILQRFHSAPTMSIYRDSAEISWCPDYVNLQRFCRDFMVPRLCQFTEILLWSINRDFT